ncbi:mob protein, partial [Bacillus cereus]
HQDLDKFLKKELPHIYKEGILNDKTIGVDTVKDLKKHSEEIQKQKDDMTAAFKEHEQKLEKEIQFLNKELESKKKELLDLSEQLSQEMKIKAKGKEKKTEVVKKGLFKSEKVTKETGNWIIGTSELKRVQKMVNAAYVVKKDYERLQNTDLVQENQNLRVHGEYLKKENKELSYQFDDLYDSFQESQKENRKLNTEISSLKAHIKDLQTNIRVLYQQTKKVFKEQFKVFRGLVKNELDMKGIENQFEREYKKEIASRQRGYDMER